MARIRPALLPKGGTLPHLNTLRYRRDIDGLRAVAVVVVILFHFGVEAFAGGLSEWTSSS